MSRDVLRRSAMEIGARYRSRQLDPVDVVDAHIERIKAVNPSLNAVVAERFDAAREEAKIARALFQKRGGEPPPILTGVPCTIKEFCGVKGMPHTGGVWSMRDHTASEDGTVVARLREAGAIVLGVTNVPEGGVWAETNNRVFGRTNNPWDTNRTSGGSSGGEGAIIAAGGSVFGLGSDVGGSIRIPAAFCGIVGHKPTHRTVPSTGHYPPAIGGKVAPFTMGPMTRKVADLYPLLNVMTGADGRDPLCTGQQLIDPASVRIENLRVFPVESDGRTKVSKEFRQIIHSGARCLERRGAKVSKLNNKKLRYAFDLWAAVMKEFGPEYAEIVGENGHVQLYRELSRYPRGRSAHTGPVLLLMVVERLLERFSGTIQKRLALIHELQTELENEIGDNGILLYPPFSRPAPRHRAFALTFFDAACTALFNVLEFPVTQLPMGVGSRRLPLGVQIVAARGNDHLTIAAASALEGDFGGWELVEPHRSRMWLTLV